MVELKQMQFFVACVEEGSFSRAAEVLYTSQPNISKVIRELEQELGMKLFERGGRGIVPTQEGRRMYQYATEILQREQTIRNLARSRMKNHLRISTNQSRSMAHLLADYRSIRREQMFMQALDRDTDNVLKDVERFRSDLGFVLLATVQHPAFEYHLERHNMQSEVIFKTRACITMGEYNHFAHSRTLRLKEICQENFIRYSDDFFSLENALSTMEPALRPAMEEAVISNSSAFIINILNNTNLCNIGVQPFFSTELHDGIRLAMLEPEIPVYFMAIYREKPEGEAARFLDYMREAAGKEV